MKHPMTPLEKENRQLKMVDQVIEILDQKKPFDTIMTEIAGLLPTIYDIPHILSVRIKIDGKAFTNASFEESIWSEKQKMDFPDQTKGSVEFFYTRDYLESTHGSGFALGNAFISKISNVLTGFISRFKLEKLYYDNRERLKELKSINLANAILKKHKTLEESLQEICSLLPEAWQYPRHTVARITFDEKVYKSKRFKETPWGMKQFFETPDNKKGMLEIFYLKEFPEAHEGPFLKEERSLLDILASIISGTYSNQSLQDLLIKNSERLKELRGINKTSEILTQSKSIEESLEIVCSILPEAWQYPEFTVARIKFGEKVFASPNFRETRWVQRQEFETPGNKKGEIEIFLLKEFPEADEGPFLKEERNLLINLANLIAGSATSEIFNKLLNENKERLKELKAINRTSQLIAEGKPVDETLTEIAKILPRSWQYPKHTKVKILFEGKEYTTPGYKDTPWAQKENFITIDNKKGCIQVVYLKEFPKSYEGPFLKEERNLLVNIGKLIGGYLNNYKGREIYRKNLLGKKEQGHHEEFRKSLITNKRPLQLFFNQQLIDKYIYLDMMKYKVREILFVATLYDAFILENEDSFFEQFMGEIYQYSLFSLPRITGVTTPEEALAVLGTKSFDLVVLMVGLDRELPVSLSKKIKQKVPSLPIYLLLNQKSQINYFEDLVASSNTLDKLFVWNGDSQIIFALVKSIEDKANVSNDTQVGLVRVILLVEDSPLYYSKYLQILYSIVFGQVQQLLPEVEKNELDKICKMRSRPKILLATNYEDAMDLFNRYKDFMLCVISDIEYDRDGKPDKTAGIKFIQYVKSHILNLPIILQSADDKNKGQADKQGVQYINKNSETLLNDLKSYLTYYLGFGDFIFRDKKGNAIATAKTIREFERLLGEIPDESFYLHAVENQLSIWLMARGEIQLAKTLNPIKIGSIDEVAKSRKQTLDALKKYREEKKKGKILGFDETATIDEKNIVTFAGGSFGGKGRGLAFINTLIYNLDFPSFSDQINIRAPKTVIIGTDEFDSFILNNSLYDKIMGQELSFDFIKQHFINAKLTAALEEKLSFFLEQVNKPIAVRSSSLSEDSFTQPFAGIFHTYIVPNSTENKALVAEKLKQAIKLVFASIFSDEAKGYFKAIHHKVEDEKMAIVLQELVGNQFGDYYYPHISGTACSFNYYPVAHMEPNEGFAMAAFGLGSYVVEGMNSYRFSPKYPNVDMYTPKDLINSSQVKFYAVDCSKNDVDYSLEGELASLALLDISEAENHGSLKHCVSVYDPQNDRIVPGLSAAGPRILNFANILKYNYIPLASTLEMLLGTIKEALGSPVEIEYCVDLSRSENGLATFYLLQIKPMVDNQSKTSFDLSQYKKSDILLYSKTSLGNGEVTDICDVIYVDKEKFDKMKTMDMVGEIEYLNNLMIQQNKHYVLIGPGRWGTRDQYLGIPVNWSQISNAKIIVEASLANFPLDSSLGSHFFHNVTSMNIGYLSVLDSSNEEFINWDKLYKEKVVHETHYFRHVRLHKPLKILMNGREKESIIIEN
jgi:hypothetical protein